jgi:hypothetical protein
VKGENVPDPKLKQAAKDIKDILEKADIAGHIILVSPTHSEFVFHLQPSWSAISISEPDEKGAVSMRVKATKEELGSREAVAKKVELTAHLICQLKDLSVMCFQVADNILKTIETKYRIDHKPFFEFEKHDEKYVFKGDTK